MTDLERFLRLATWSLWGAQKRTVRLELESHIAHKTWKYQTRGFSETEALQKALVDLGQPHVISAGMTGVYTMPTLFRNTVLVGLLLSLGITTFQSSAQVAGTSRTPIQPCLDTANKTVNVGKNKISCEDIMSFYISVDALKSDLIPKGVIFDQTEIPQYPDNKDIKKYTTMTFPKGERIVLSESNNLVFVDTEIALLKQYVSAGHLLLEALPKSNLPVTLSGWDKPKVTVGETQFDISFEQALPKPQFLYGSLIMRMLLKQFEKQRYGVGSYDMSNEQVAFSPSWAEYQKNFRIDADPERAYTVLTLEKLRKDNVIFARVLHISSNGFEVTDQLKNLEFVDSWDKLKPIVLGGKNPQRSGTAILARVNTILNDPKQILEIINPKEIQVIGSAERVIAKDTIQSSFCKDKGGANTTLSGHWIGELQSFDVKGQKVTGKLNNKIQPSGVYEGLFESRQAKSSGMTLGAFCNNNQFTGSLEYEAPRFAVNTSMGSIKQLSPTLIEGSSIERDENNNIISRTYFRLRKQ